MRKGWQPARERGRKKNLKISSSPLWAQAHTRKGVRKQEESRGKVNLLILSLCMCTGEGGGEGVEENYSPSRTYARAWGEEVEEGVSWMQQKRKEKAQRRRGRKKERRRKGFSSSPLRTHTCVQERRRGLPRLAIKLLSIVRNRKATELFSITIDFSLSHGKEVRERRNYTRIVMEREKMQKGSEKC